MLTSTCSMGLQTLKCAKASSSQHLSSTLVALQMQTHTTKHVHLKQFQSAAHNPAYQTAPVMTHHLRQKVCTVSYGHALTCSVLPMGNLGNHITMQQQQQRTVSSSN
jgi:hypothetical protein